MFIFLSIEHIFGLPINQKMSSLFLDLLKALDVTSPRPIVNGPVQKLQIDFLESAFVFSIYLSVVQIFVLHIHNPVFFHFQTC